MSTYFVVFPSGIEDVVRDELLRFIDRFLPAHPTCRITLLSGKPARQLFVTKRHNRNEPKPVAADAHEGAVTESDDPFSPRGLLYFSVSALSTASDTDAREAEYDFIYQLSFSLRTVEQVCFSLGSLPMHTSAADLELFVTKHAAVLHDAVTEKLSAYRAWLGNKVADPSYRHRLPGLTYGRSFLTPVTDSTVLFRVNCLRRDKTFPVNSQHLAAHVGDKLMECFEETGWRVNMIYHHVEFFLLHDHARTGHLGLVFSAPALPRCGMDLCPARQLFSEYLRQHIGSMLVRGAIADYTQVKGLVSRPAALRYEMRLAKGENAMHPALAAALSCYADIHPTSHLPQSEGGPSTLEDNGPLTLLDPFGGSGSILSEAWLYGDRTPITAFCGELVEEDYSRAQRNTSPAAVAGLALLNGLAPLPQGADAVLGEVEKWKCTLESLAENFVVAEDHESTAAALVRVTEAVDFQGLTHRVIDLVGTTFASSVFNAPMTVFCADATHMPFRNGSIDRVVSDVPFGRRCGSHRQNNLLYPLFLRECHRVLANPLPEDSTRIQQGDCHEDEPVWWKVSSHGRSGGRAVLLTLDARCMMETVKSLQNECPFRLVTQPFMVEMAGLYPYVFVLDKR